MTFLRAVEADGEWKLTARIDGAVTKTLPARELWDRVACAAWASADPGVQFDTTINDWHTCAEAGPIRASNPCSEYMFLDDTACNLASLNLMRFRDAKGRLRHGGLRPRGAPVDGDARDLGDDGRLPGPPHRRAFVRLPHPGLWATPTSARC